MKNPLYLLICLFLVLFACSKDDTTTPEPEPVQVPKYTVSIKAGDGGTVSSAGGTFNKDSEVSVTASPNSEYLFEAWSDGNTDNPRTIKVGGDITITANFIKKQYDLTVNIVGEGAVSEEVVIQGSRYNSGSQIKLIAMPAEGWEFSSWTGAIESTDNMVTLTLDGAKEVTANFSELPPIYLGANGVTIIAEEWAQTGESYELNGETYIIASQGNLGDLLVQNPDRTNFIVTTRVTNLDLLFRYKDFQGDISSWDVSNVTSMVEMFWGTPFNQPIGNWDVSNVENMGGMFGDSNFNQPIGNWDVSSVENMGGMFSGTPFNQTISNWDVSNVSYMASMFYNSSFNKEIGGWDVSNVTHMDGMFHSSEFNKDLSNWNVSNVIRMDGMFTNSSFNQPIGNWDVSSVEHMGGMFADSNFNQPIGDWDVSSVIAMDGLFEGASSFNQEIGGWDVSNVRHMDRIFSGSVFNQDIGDWDVSLVLGMEYMFFRSSFNKNISDWDVSNVENMGYMFWEASSFNQDLSNWSVENVVFCAGFSVNAASWALPKPNFTNCRGF